MLLLLLALFASASGLALSAARHDAGAASTRAVGRGRCAVSCAVSAAGEEVLGTGTVAPTAAAADADYGSRWLANAVKASPCDTALLAPLRATASAELPSCSFPRRKDEAWRRCDISSLRASRIVPPRDAAGTAEMAAATLARCSDLEDTAGMRLVLVDGVCSDELSDLSDLPEGVYAGSVVSSSSEAAVRAAVAACEGELPETNADPRTANGCHAFACLNQASMRDLVSVHVPDGVAVERPLHVVCLSSGAGESSSGGGAAEAATLAASHPSLVVSLGDGASLQLLQQYAGDERSGYFTNGLTRIVLGSASQLQHSYVQEQAEAGVHIDTVLVEAAERATYSNQLLQTGGRIARVNLAVNLAGGGAHSDLKGLTLSAGNQLADVHTRVVHAVPDCTSEQEHRNAVSGKARVVFRGAVAVPRGADNSTANQLCRTLLLSDSAKVDVSPTLEIDTDDVQCTHGATISDLDDEMIFYLQARGLSRLDARTLLLEGWARSALSQVPAEAARQRASAKAATLAPDLERRVRREALSSI